MEEKGAVRKLNQDNLESNATSLQRLFASMFDFAAMLLISLIILIPGIIVLVDAIANPSTARTIALGIVMFLTGGLSALFEIIYTVTIPYHEHGQTLGLRFFDLRMVQENGEDVTLKSLFIRSFTAVILSFTTFGLYLLAEAFAYFLTSSHRNFADVTSQIKVVSLKKDE